MKGHFHFPFPFPFYQKEKYPSSNISTIWSLPIKIPHERWEIFNYEQNLKTCLSVYLVSISVAYLTASYIKPMQELLTK